MRALSLLLLFAACEHGQGGGVGGEAACTAIDQEVAGTELIVQPVDIFDTSSTCDKAALVLDGQALSDRFNGNLPAELAAVDFAVDRVVLGLSNPVLQFAVDDGSTIIVGIEPICQGIAPHCVGYIIRNVTHNALDAIDCPYRGPEPCDAP